MIAPIYVRIRRVIRFVLVPFVLGTLPFGGPAHVWSEFWNGPFDLFHLSALLYGYFLGLVFLGLIGIAIWMWDALDLLGLPPGIKRRCPRCGGSGMLNDNA